MKRGLFLAVLAILSWGTVCYGAPSQPVANVEGGLYEGVQTVSFTCDDDCDIYYTTNGDMPTASSKHYSAPIEVREEWETPNGGSRTSMEQSPKGTVIRAIAIDSGGEVSTVSNNTYIIASNIFDLYRIPVLALTVSDYDLYDSTYGIWANPRYEHKVNAYVEYFESDGTLGFKRGVTTRISGQWSLDYLKKSIRLYFNDNNYENPSAKKYVSYNLYDDSYQNIFSRNLVNRFGKLTLRCSDFEGTNLHDPAAQKLSKRLNVDSASSRPVALFISGEFFGVYELREQYDNRYTQFHYESIDKDEVVAFSRESLAARRIEDSPLPASTKTYTAKNEYQEGPSNSNADSLLGENYYRRLINHILALITECDITDDAVYAEVSNYIDIDSYLDWIAMYVYAGSDDWSGNNTRFWRTTEEGSDGLTLGADGKIRFLIHDLDLSFSSTSHDTLYSSMISTASVTRRTPLSRETLLCMFKNPSFREEFAQRMMVYLSTAFSKDVVYDDIGILIDRTSYAKERDLKRWNLLSGSISSWNSQVASLRGWANGRNSYVVSMIKSFYNTYLAQSVPSQMTSVTFNTDTAHGYIRVAGADISPALYGDYTYPTSFSADMYRGMPITVEGVCDAGYKSVCTLSYGRNQITVSGKPLTFTIPTDSSDTYTVTLEFTEGENEPDTFLGSAVLMRDYEFENLTEPITLDLMGEFAISGWQKLFGTNIYVKDGCREDVVAVDGRTVTPMRRGTTTLCAAYGENVYEFDVTVPLGDRLLSPKAYKSVTASDDVNYYFVMSNAIDGIISTRWESGLSESWVMGEFYAVRDITTVDVMYRNTSTYDSHLQYSLNGTDWLDCEAVSTRTMQYDDRLLNSRLAANKDATATTANIVTYAVNAPARFLRVYFPTRVGNNASVNEIWAYTKSDCGVILNVADVTKTTAGAKCTANIYSAQKNQNARLVAIAYDESGLVIGAKTLYALKEGDALYTFNITAAGFNDSCSVKVFVWDRNSVVPLME